MHITVVMLNNIGLYTLLTIFYASTLLQKHFTDNDADTKAILENQEIPGTNKELKILCIGDSITKGYYEPKHPQYNHPYSVNLQRLINSHYGSNFAKVDTQGVGGETVFPTMQQRLRKVLRSHKYDIVILMGGVNDLVHSDVLKRIDLFKEIRSLVGIAVAQSGKAVVLTMLEAYPQASKLKHVNVKDFLRIRKEVNHKIRGLGSSKVTVCDTAKTFPLKVLPSVEVKKLWGKDNVHPTPEGYDKLGEKVFECIEEFLTVKFYD